MPERGQHSFVCSSEDFGFSGHHRRDILHAREPQRGGPGRACWECEIRG